MPHMHREPDPFRVRPAFDARAAVELLQRQRRRAERQLWQAKNGGKGQRKDRLLVASIEQALESIDSEIDRLQRFMHSSKTTTMMETDKQKIEAFFRRHRSDTFLVPVHLTQPQITALKHLENLTGHELPDLVMLLMQHLLNECQETFEVLQAQEQAMRN